MRQHVANCVEIVETQSFRRDSSPRPASYITFTLADGGCAEKRGGEGGGEGGG